MSVPRTRKLVVTRVVVRETLRRGLASEMLFLQLLLWQRLAVLAEIELDRSEVAAPFRKAAVLFVDPRFSVLHSAGLAVGLLVVVFQLLTPPAHVIAGLGILGVTGLVVVYGGDTQITGPFGFAIVVDVLVNVLRTPELERVVWSEGIVMPLIAGHARAKVLEAHGLFRLPCPLRGVVLVGDRRAPGPARTTRVRFGAGFRPPFIIVSAGAAGGPLTPLPNPIRTRLILVRDFLIQEGLGPLLRVFGFLVEGAGEPGAETDPLVQGRVQRAFEGKLRRIAVELLDSIPKNRHSEMLGVRRFAARDRFVGPAREAPPSIVRPPFAVTVGMDLRESRQIAVPHDVHILLAVLSADFVQMAENLKEDIAVTVTIAIPIALVPDSPAPVPPDSSYHFSRRSSHIMDQTTLHGSYCASFVLLAPHMIVLSRTTKMLRRKKL